MAQKKVAIILVQMAVVVDDHNAATMADTVSAILSENLAQNGVITDWAYLQDKKDNYIHPIPAGSVDTKQFEEGEIFNRTNSIRLDHGGIVVHGVDDKTKSILLTIEQKNLAIDYFLIHSPDGFKWLFFDEDLDKIHDLINQHTKA